MMGITRTFIKLLLPAIVASGAAAASADTFDFCSRPQGLDSAYVREALAAYLSPLAGEPDSVRRSAVYVMLDSASTDADVSAVIMYEAEDYLYAPESPGYDEALFAHFLQYRVDSVGGDIRAEALLADIRRNAPGMPAPDFSFVGRDGAEHTLYEVADGHRMTILLFYDPDCVECHEAAAMLASDADLNRMLASGEIAVVAVYLEDDAEAWARRSGDFPAEWIVGHDRSQVILDNELYGIGSIPSVYLLDSALTVVLKDTDAATALGRISEAGR